MKNALRPGTKVCHRWGNPLGRPTILPQYLVDLHGFENFGILLEITDESPYSDSTIPYWNVKLGDKVSQWREDLIDLVS